MNKKSEKSNFILPSPPWQCPDSNNSSSQSGSEEMINGIIAIPIKLTRSLLANAIARANVPIRTIILNTLTFTKCNNCINIVEAINTIVNSIMVLVFIQARISSGTKGEPFKPLMKIK